MHLAPRRAAWGAGEGAEQSNKCAWEDTEASIRLSLLQRSKAGRGSGLWLSDSGGASAPHPQSRMGKPADAPVRSAPPQCADCTLKGGLQTPRGSGLLRHGEQGSRALSARNRERSRATRARAFKHIYTNSCCE